MTDLLALTADLVDIASPSFDEGPITDWLERELRAVPWLEVTRLEHNLVARTQFGRAQRVVLAGHTDTVPINDNMPSRIDGDVLWGCGTSDMKSGLAVMLELARTVDTAAVDATYVFYEAEEVAEAHNGLRKLFAAVPHLLAGDIALLGEPTDGVIEAGCQGTMRAQVTFAGERAHTARPWMGRNAVHRMAGVLGRLASYQERRPLVDGCEYREAMQAVAVDAGVAGNVVPDRAVLRVNHRFAPDRTVEQAEAHMREVLGADLDDRDTFEIVECSPGAVPGLSHRLMAALIERNNLPVRAKLGWTDVARFSAMGIPAANFGPGDATLAHTHGEFVRRAPIETVYAALVDLLVRGDASP
jgi:succinyl-diaminopimelate desuccinylase